MMTSALTTEEETGAGAQDMELTVEEVAQRLGLPVDMLIRRIEAGDVPARRVDEEGRVRYLLHLDDLGAASEAMGGPAAEVRGVLVGASPTEGASRMDELGGAEDGPVATDHIDGWPTAADLSADVEDLSTGVEHGVAGGEAEALSLVDAGVDPYTELGAIALNGRDLVAGLLDRWERSLERRIHAEMRQRFDADLHERQSQVRRLELELRTARAEHAAIQSEKDRIIAEQARLLSQRERELREGEPLRRRFNRIFGR